MLLHYKVVLRPKWNSNRLGPFTYELTTKREVLYHDVESGVLTYREYNGTTSTIG